MAEDIYEKSKQIIETNNHNDITYRKISSSKSQCLVCPNKCILKENQSGACFVRSNKLGKIILSEYGKISTISVDPIEKKPFYHYKPGSKTISFGGFGCSMRCDYCENYKISQNNIKENTKFFYPNDLCSIARQKNCDILCFTYNEPTTYFEYMIDIYDSCLQNNMYFIIKTNGYVRRNIWKEICNNVHAMNIDWKGEGEFYRKTTLVKDNVTLDNIYIAKSLNKHVEISVPVYYDSSLKDYDNFISLIEKIDKNIPVHLIKIYPSNKIKYTNLTSDFLLYNLFDYMKNKLSYVYIQGSINDYHRNTTCHNCSKLIVERQSLKSFCHGECCQNCPIIY